jgi:hypothetical protein
MSDPVVVITNGIPTSGTGTITTLGQTLIDGANVTLGATGDASVSAGAVGSISAKLRAISRDIAAGVSLAASANVIGTVRTADGSGTLIGSTGNALDVNIKSGASSGAVAQGSTTAGQTGPLTQAAVSTAAPTYTNGQTSPLSLDPTGALRVNVTAGGAGGGAVTNAGTFAVQVTSAPTTAVTGAFFQATQPVSLASVPSHAVTHAGTFAVQSAATLAAETTKVIGVTRTADGAGNLLTSTGNALDINIKSGGGSGGTALADKGAFVAGTTVNTPIGGFFQTTPTANPLTTGQSGWAQMTATRALFTSLRDSTGLEVTKLGSTGAPAASDPAIAVTIRDVNANGRAAAASSAPIAFSTEDNALVARLLPTATASGVTPSRINAAASTNATSLKASAGQLYTIDVFNPAAYNVFLKFYNKASAPTVGTDTPVLTIPIQAGGGYSARWPSGLPFATGIAYAITKLQADSDTTVVVAGDLTGNTTWI